MKKASDMWWIYANALTLSEKESKNCDETELSIHSLQNM